MVRTRRAEEQWLDHVRRWSSVRTRGAVELKLEHV